MLNTNPSKERRDFLVVVGILFTLSLIGAVVFFYGLDSLAQIQNKFISLGGAIAGFVVIFILLRSTYFRVTSTEREFGKLSANEKVRNLEKQIEDLLINKFDDFNIPQGYKAEISKEFRFGFCYPEDWGFSRFSELKLYGGAVDEKSGNNIVIAISDITDQEKELDEIYKAELELQSDLFPKAQVIFRENILFHGLPASKHLLNYETNSGLAISLYQIMVTDKKKQNLYVLSFTTSQGDFNSMRGVFDNIAGTFRL